jgi:hypothetical protein
VHFYDVGGLLVRRAKRVSRGVYTEVWQGDGWVAYPDLNAVLRHGHRLTDADALALLLLKREQLPALTHLSDQEARAALRAPRKRL